MVKARRPCRCIRSKCLKLYCECFSSGVYCDGCSCMNCQNNIENDGTRSEAMASILDRKPDAFRPKIVAISQYNSQVAEGSDSSALVVGRHKRGCHCSRTNCLKNYCECFQANISCCERCRCIGCRNARFSNRVLVAPTPHVDYEKFEAYFDLPNVRASTATGSANDNVTQRLNKRKFEDHLDSNKVPMTQNPSQELQEKLIVVDTSSPSHSAESSESANRRFMFADLVQSPHLEGLEGLCPALIVLSEAANFLAGIQNTNNSGAAGTRPERNDVQKFVSNSHLSSYEADASDKDDSGSDGFDVEAWTSFASHTEQMESEKEGSLLLPTNSGDQKLDCVPGITAYAEQERAILTNFLNYLANIITLEDNGLSGRGGARGTLEMTRSYKKRSGQNDEAPDLYTCKIGLIDEDTCREPSVIAMVSSV